MGWQYREHAHAGSIGGKSGWNKDQQSFVTPKTTMLEASVVFDLAAATGVADITPVTSSLDGLLWLCEADEGAKKYALTLRRTFTESGSSIEPVSLTQIPATETVVQIGLDWILTDHYFLSRRRDTDALWAPVARKNGLVMPGGQTLPSTEGYNTEFEVRNETGWPFVFGYKSGNVAPFWERLNPVVGGFTILHDWLVPRPDYGFVAQTNGAKNAMWTPDFLPYDVREPAYLTNSLGHVDTPTGTKLSFWYGKPYERLTYAVFVVDGEIYIRTDKFIGTGRFVPLRKYFAAGDTEGVVVSYLLLNMHDFNVWRKNYPGLEWDRLAVGKIGKCPVVFECGEGDYDPKGLNPLRFATTGKYIPLAKKVDWSEDPDGTNAALIPPVKDMAIEEAQELKMNLSAFLGESAKVAFAYNNDIFKVSTLDENGNEITDEERTRAYKGLSLHVNPADMPFAGSLGDYIIANEKEYAFATNTRPPFERMAALYAGRPASIERHVLPGDEEAGTAPSLWEGVSIYCPSPGKLGIVDIGNIVTPDYIEKSAVEQWADAQLRPFDIRCVAAVGGTDVAENMLPADRFPVMLSTTVAGIEAGDARESLTCAWINPETGEVAAPQKYFFNGTGMRAAVRFDEATKTMQFGGRSVTDGSFEAIAAPSYLDGWMGPSDSYFFTSNAQLGYPNSTWTSSMGLKFAPALEFAEVLCEGLMTARYSATAVTGYGGLPVTGGIYQDRLFLDFPARDMFISFRVSHPLIDAMAADIVYLSSSGALYIQQKHKNSTQALGVPQYPGNLYDVNLAAFAHYGKDPFLYRESPEMWRFRQQLNIAKCRKGIDDSTSPGDGKRWTDHRFLAFRIEVNEEVFKALAGCYKLDNYFG